MMVEEFLQIAAQIFFSPSDLSRVDLGDVVIQRRNL
jgi:hypothetical protein